MTRVLIVDDKEENVYYLQTVLAGSGYDVSTARQGAEALSSARQQLPDLVVSDLLMPVMDGYTLLRNWKADARLREVPFIVYTATYTEEEDERLALSMGADAFILKPAEPDHFLTQIREVLTRVANGATRPQQVSGGYVDEHELLRVYSETLIRKLEEKTQQLEIANRALHDDIAARQSIDDALRASEARLEAATTAGRIGIWDWDLITGTIVWSRMHEMLWGLPAGSFDGRYESFRNGVHPDDRDAIDAVIQHALATHAAYQHEHRVRWPDGSVHWISGRGVASYDESGTPLRMSGVVIDITERRLADERLRRLIESNIQGVMFWNADGAVAGANDAFLRIVGFTRDDLEAGRINWRALTPPEFVALDDQNLASLADTGVAVAIEKEFYRQDGSRVPVLVGAATFDSDRQSGVCFVLDLTERRRLENQFLRAQRLESIGTLAGGIAHDLNNSLGPIAMAVELLKLRDTDRESEELLSVIEASAARGASMVRQLLSFARGIDGRRVNVRIGALMNDVTKIANETFLKHIQVESFAPTNLATVLGDPTQLHQVLMNLCVNARDAMPHGGTLRLSADNLMADAAFVARNPEAKREPYVVIQVQDNGFGMPEELLEKIFDPFFTTKDVGMGTGLGLSTSLAIVKSHGGFMQVDSTVGVGTSFRIYLPARTGEDSATDGEVSTELPRGHGQLILVVDDEVAVRRLTQRSLETFGYGVVTAADGADAVTVFHANRPAVAAVIMDMMMPVVNGVTAIQSLRALDPALPIIAVSGLATPDQISETRRLGVEHFLSKPYAASELLKTLRALLPKPSGD